MATSRVTGPQGGKGAPSFTLQSRLAVIRTWAGLIKSLTQLYFTTKW